MQRIALHPRWVVLTALAVWLSACAHSRTSSAAAPERAAPAARTPAAQQPDEVEVRVLVIAFHGAKDAAQDQARTPQEALERARMLSDMGKSGDDLAALVGKYSDRPGAGDDIGVMRVRTAASEGFEHAVAQTAAALAVGAVSEPLRTEEGYVVVQRLRDPPSGPQRIAARHILITYAGSPQPIAGATRSEAEARALAEDIARQAKAPGADWDALASQYTEEPGGKERHGDLGSFGRGQMVPAFEAAAFALHVGEVSGAVQSPFGFHVIQRTQ